jgi:hypothetical protein
MVIYFIVTKFITIALGLLCIYAYKHLNQTENTTRAPTEKKMDLAETLEMGRNEASSIALPVEAVYDQTIRSAQAAKQHSASADAMLGAVESAESAEPGSRPLSSKEEARGIQSTESKATQGAHSFNTKHKWLKVMHGFFMFYAQVMLLGAGVAFSTNNRSDFPYQRGDETDALIGRCYGRDLRDPSAPTWLSGLPCGYGLVCAVTSAVDNSTSGSNPYLSAP